MSRGIDINPDSWFKDTAPDIPRKEFGREAMSRYEK